MRPTVSLTTPGHCCCFVAVVLLLIIAEELLQMLHLESARNHPRPVGLLQRLVQRVLALMLIGYRAYNFFQQIFNRHQPATPPYSSITRRMCCFSRCISRSSSFTFFVSGTNAADL